MISNEILSFDISPNAGGKPGHFHLYEKIFSKLPVPSGKSRKDI